MGMVVKIPKSSLIKGSSTTKNEHMNQLPVHAISTINHHPKEIRITFQ